MMKRIVLIVSIIALMTSAVMADQWKIFPGKRVGPVKLGDPISKAAKIIKAKQSPIFKKDGSPATYFGIPIQYFMKLDKSKKIKSIMVYHSAKDKCITNKGIRTGEHERLMKKKMGKPVNSKANTLGMTYRFEGISFITDGDGIIKNIIVHR